MHGLQSSQHASVVGGTLQLEDATCCLRRIRGEQGASAEAGSPGCNSQPSKSLVSNSTESRFREVGRLGLVTAAIDGCSGRLEGAS